MLTINSEVPLILRWMRSLSADGKPLSQNGHARGSQPLRYSANNIPSRKASVVTDRIFEPWDLQQQSRWRSVCIPAILRRKAPPSSGDDTITACAQVLAARLSASSTALISGSVSSDGSSTVINIIVDRDGSGRVKSLGG